MYLRHKSLDAVLSIVKDSIVNELQSGMFLKVGFDEVESVKSYWVFVPDFKYELEELDKVDK